MFTPEATLSGVARRSLSGQHASTPSAAAAEGPYQCVALGDPIMDLIGFERMGEVLSRPEFALYDRRHGGGLWVGKVIRVEKKDDES